MVRRQLGRGPQEELAPLVGGAAALVAGVEEPVAEELELELVEPVLVDHCADVGERARLEHVLEVGVPDAHAPEADALRLLAAVAQVEEAPLAAEVHLDRAGDRPVVGDEGVGAGHHPTT